jgi:hypothetical protein
MSTVLKSHTWGSNLKKEMIMKTITAALLAVSVLTGMSSPSIADDEPWTAERFWEELSRRQFWNILIHSVTSEIDPAVFRNPTSTP